MGHAQSKFDMERNFGIRDATNRREKKSELKNEEKKEPKPRVPITPKYRSTKITKKVSKKLQKSIIEANKVVIIKPNPKTPNPKKILERRIWMP